jgi:septum formation inhibitor-activating ATPase MinD
MLLLIINGCTLNCSLVRIQSLPGTAIWLTFTYERTEKGESRDASVASDLLPPRRLERQIPIRIDEIFALLTVIVISVVIDDDVVVAAEDDTESCVFPPRVLIPIMANNISIFSSQ